jgi:hypothetical protein
VTLDDVGKLLVWRPVLVYGECVGYLALPDSYGRNGVGVRVPVPSQSGGLFDVLEFHATTIPRPGLEPMPALTTTAMHWELWDLGEAFRDVDD